MRNMGRRIGVAPLALLGLSLGLAGCFSPEDEFQPMLSRTSKNLAGNSPTAGATGRPGGPAAPDDSSDSRSAALYRPEGRIPLDGASMRSGNGVVQTGYHPPVRVVPASADGPATTLPPASATLPPAASTAPAPAFAPGHDAGGDSNDRPLPNELAPVSHPPYRVAPPDILIIDALRIVPRGPYRLEPLEVLQVAIEGTVPNKPIAGAFMISPEGTVNLGYDYGTVRVGGLTLEQAQRAIYDHLSNQLRNPAVNLGVAQFRGLQQIAGQHLVRPDGTIGLGTYGSVYVAGLTLGQVKCELEKYLGAYLVAPQLSVDVLAYNSQKIFVVVDGGGFGQQVIPLPVTGNETVLDAISRVSGLAPVSSKRRIWVARPSPANSGCNVVLPVDWQAIVMNGQTATNYQLFPGDRVFIGANKLICFNNYLAQVLAPVEQIFGVTLLGANTVRSIQAVGNNNNNGGGFFFVP